MALQIQLKQDALDKSVMDYQAKIDEAEEAKQANRGCLSCLAAINTETWQGCIDGISKNATNSKVVTKVSDALYDLVNEELDIREEMVNCGALDVIFGALSIHAENAVVAEAILQVITALCVNNDTTKLAILRHEGSMLLISVAGNHAMDKDSPILRQVMWCLAHLAEEDDLTVSGDQDRSMVDSMEIVFILKILKSHIDDLQVTRAATTALYNLSSAKKTMMNSAIDNRAFVKVSSADVDHEGFYCCDGSENTEWVPATLAAVEAFAGRPSSSSLSLFRGCLSACRRCLHAACPPTVLPALPYSRTPVLPALPYSRTPVLPYLLPRASPVLRTRAPPHPRTP
jgi:hypothetical protein